MTFRRRMLGAVMALTLLTLGGAFAAIALSVNRAQERQLDAALLAEAREEAAEIASIGGRRLTISDRPGPAANDVGPLTKYGAIYGADGAVIAATPTWRHAPPRAAALPGENARPFDLYADREHLRGVLVHVPGPTPARLLLAAPRADLDGDASFLHRAMAMVLLVACAWTLGLASWFTQRLTRDQQRIMEVAHRAAGGDLTARVAQNSSDADLSQLGRDLDDTLTRLEASVEAQRRFIAYAAHELRGGDDPVRLRAGLAPLIEDLQRRVGVDGDLGLGAVLVGHVDEHVHVPEGRHRALDAQREDLRGVGERGRCEVKEAQGGAAGHRDAPSQVMIMAGNR